MLKVLIIGGTGVISTAVAQRLIDRGDEVTLLNRGRTPVRLRGSFNAISGDRADRAGFERAIHASGVWDCVIDMICSLPEDAASLARALHGRTGQLIFCSTTNVYPKPADAYPVREDHWLGAAFKNGVDKAQCEVIHRQAEHAGAYTLTVVRPGHTFGEGGSVLHSLGNHTSFLDRIRHGRPIVVHGDGQGLWSALHADDVASVFATATGQAKAFGRTFNATGTQWITWDRYCAGIAEALGAELPEIVHIPTDALAVLAPARAAQCKRSLQYPGIYDMTAARDVLGFGSRVSFVEGMRRTIVWLESHGRVEPWDADIEYESIVNAWTIGRRRATVPAGDDTGPANG